MHKIPHSDTFTTSQPRRMMGATQKLITLRLCLLTHWPLTDAALFSNFQTHIKDRYFFSIFCKTVLVWVPKTKIPRMVSQHWFRERLGTIRQHAMTWINVDQVPWRQMASLIASHRVWMSSNSTNLRYIVKLLIWVAPNPKNKMFLASSFSCLCPIHWSRQAMLQLHLSDQQFYCLLRCGLY